jgi:hypothetical protein
MYLAKKAFGQKSPRESLAKRLLGALARYLTNTAKKFEKNL